MHLWFLSNLNGLVSSNMKVLEMQFVACSDLYVVGSRWCLSFCRQKIVYSWIV